MSRVTLMRSSGVESKFVSLKAMTQQGCEECHHFSHDSVNRRAQTWLLSRIIVFTRGTSYGKSFCIAYLFYFVDR